MLLAALLAASPPAMAPAAALFQDAWPIERTLAMEYNRALKYPDLSGWRDVAGRIDAEVARCSARHPDLMPCQRLLLMQAVASVRSLQPTDRALAIFARLLPLTERASGPQSEQTLRIIDGYAEAASAISHPDIKEDMLRLLVARSAGHSPETRAGSLLKLGLFLRQQGRQNEAEAVVERAAAIMREKGDENSVVAQAIALERAVSLAAKDDIPGALSQAGAVCRYTRQHRAQLGAAHAQCMSTLGGLQVALGRYEDAMASFDEAAEAHFNASGKQAPPTVIALADAGDAASRAGRSDAAEQRFALARQMIAQQAMGPANPFELLVGYRRATHLERTGQSLREVRSELLRAKAGFDAFQIHFGEYDRQTSDRYRAAVPLFTGIVSANWKLANE